MNKLITEWKGNQRQTMATHLLINVWDVCLRVLHLDQPLLSILALDPTLVHEGACGTHVECNLAQEAT